MTIDQIKQLHREYFENYIKSLINNQDWFIYEPGKYVFIFNLYYHEKTKIEKITPTFYSVFLIDINEFDGINREYIVENKSIQFNNLITIYDKKHILDVWRCYRKILNISELNEYIKTKSDITYRSNYNKNKN